MSLCSLNVKFFASKDILITLLFKHLLLPTDSITNLSHKPKTRSIHFKFTVGLNSDPEKVKQIIQDEIRESEHTVPREGEEYSPVYFLAYMDNGLQMATTVYYTPDSPTEVVKDDVNCRVKRALDANNIEIPYNYVTVTTPPEKPDGKA